MCGDDLLIDLKTITSTAQLQYSLLMSMSPDDQARARAGAGKEPGVQSRWRAQTGDYWLLTTPPRSGDQYWPRPVSEWVSLRAYVGDNNNDYRLVLQFWHPNSQSLVPTSHSSSLLKVDTDGLTDEQYYDLQVCFAEKHWSLHLKCHNRQVITRAGKM